jgi:hypothetical protein
MDLNVEPGGDHGHLLRQARFDKTPDEPTEDELSRYAEDVVTVFFHGTSPYNPDDTDVEEIINFIKQGHMFQDRGNLVVRVGSETITHIINLARSQVYAEKFREAVSAKLEERGEIWRREMIKKLVIDPINKLEPHLRYVKDEVRTGEEIAEAIPDVKAFLKEITLNQRDGIFMDFLELNEAGQLVYGDICQEAYGLGENALQAKIRQTRIVSRGDDDKIQVMTGEEYFKVTEEDKGRPVKMELSDAAKNISPESILMVRGLPTLKMEGDELVGEYIHIVRNILWGSHIDRSTTTWTDDDSLDASQARDACWPKEVAGVWSLVCDATDWDEESGSRGVLRVNLNL